ncbi:MAG: cell division protein ZapA [Acidiferrobacteraceae bacterium]
MSARDAAVVSILGQDYHIACPVEERPALEAAARLVDERMREVQGSGKAMGMDRCAMVVALNIANEFLAVRSRGVSGDVERRIDRISAKIDAVLKQKLSETHASAALRGSV